jgi:Bacterial archaeo-eukaryotic release factor family 3
MRQLSIDRLNDVLADQEPPCISLYQPTHRPHTENQQDPIRYSNLLRAITGSLEQKYPTRDVRAISEKFEALARDDHFWNHRTEGLAVLSSLEQFQIFELQRDVPELYVVADSFHTKPLLHALQSADRYQVLALNRHEATLYEGNRYALDPIELRNVASTITEALGEELTEPHLTVASYGKGSGAPRAPHGQPRMYHGHGSKKDEVEIDIVRFFRAIDRGILEHHSRPSSLPLILAALPEYHAPFREVSYNPFLIAQGIEVNPDALSQDQLRGRAWQILEPIHIKRLTELADRFNCALSQATGSDDLASVAQATSTGRVGTLLVEAERQIPGRFDESTGRIEQADLNHPEVDDVLDDLAENVMRMKGEVVVLPAERMPSTTGLAAIYRF